MQEFKIQSMAQVVRAIRFQMETKEAYELHPDRLSSIVNYALYLHTLEKDYEQASVVYKRAAQIAKRHPVLLYGYACFILSENKYPRKRHAAEAHKLINLARQLDPEGARFQLALKVCQPPWCGYVRTLQGGSRRTECRASSTGAW